MNRKRRMQQYRKDILRMGATEVKIRCTREWEGEKLPKKEWGYCVEYKLKGYSVASPDYCWFESWKGAWECAKWIFNDMPEYEGGNKNGT